MSIGLPWMIVVEETALIGIRHDVFFECYFSNKIEQSKDVSFEVKIKF